MNSANSLKLITLNIWGGHVEEPLLSFVKSKQEIDIFCFQEVYCKAKAKISDETRYINLDIFSEIQSLLPNHTGYFRPVVQGIYGIAMFVKKHLLVIEEGERIVYANDNYIGIGPTHSRILQYAQIEHSGQRFTAVNLHGLWNGMGKGDSAERIDQSLKIKNFLDSTNDPKILCGDFNLKPDTKSLEILSQGLNDHIEINGVQSTRTSFYPGAERFADYIYTSKNIDVQNFQVLPEEISDHAALQIDFTIVDAKEPPETRKEL
jgi:endonuclease/exonuclease/phosphatase family metal-dependent hydrolase